MDTLIQSQKRISKKPDSYIIPQACYPRKRKKLRKRKTIQQGSYQLIPLQLKFKYCSSIYPLYCDIALGEKDGTLIAQTVALNEIALCRGIEVSSHKHHRSVSILLEKRITFDPSSNWRDMVDKLISDGTYEQQEWGHLIKKFSTNYEDMLRARSSKVINICGYDENSLQKISERGEQFLFKMFEKFPCIQFSSSVIDNQIRVSRINLNDKYLEELGFSVESFTSTTLRDGLPNMTPDGARTYEKFLIGNFFSVESSFHETPEYLVDMTMKSGVVKKVKYRVVFTPRFYDKTFCINTRIILCGIEDSIKKEEKGNPCLLNKKYLEEMMKKENQSDEFLGKYYEGERYFMTKEKLEF